MNQPIIFAISPLQSVVFGGVVWTPLIGSKLPKKSRKEAAARKATHFISAGQSSSAVGTIQLKTEKGSKRKYYSAGAIFALSHPNHAFASRTSLPDGRVYMVASHDGVVIKGTDVVCTADEAANLLADFINRYPNGTEVPPDETAPLKYLTSQSELVPLQNAWQQIPMPARVALGVLLAVLIADTSWTKWKIYKVKRDRAQNVQQVVDEHAEWVNALDTWAQATKVDGTTGLRFVYETLGEIPTVVGDWKLVEAGCSAVAEGWSCNARYLRTVLATNNTFINDKPANWTASWDGLNAAIGNWIVPATRTGIDRKHLMSISTFSTSYVSQLQRLFPTFKRVDLQPATKVVIEEPVARLRSSTGGVQVVPVPYPASDLEGIEIPSAQAFTFSGPLRNFSVLRVGDETVIKQLRFVVDPQRDFSPTIRDSALTAELIGDMYVQ